MSEDLGLSMARQLGRLQSSVHMYLLGEIDRGGLRDALQRTESTPGEFIFPDSEPAR